MAIELFKQQVAPFALEEFEQCFIFQSTTRGLPQKLSIIPRLRQRSETRSDFCIIEVITDSISNQRIDIEDTFAEKQITYFTMYTKPIITIQQINNQASLSITLTFNRDDKIIKYPEVSYQFQIPFLFNKAHSFKLDIDENKLRQYEQKTELQQALDSYQIELTKMYSVYTLFQYTLFHCIMKQKIPDYNFFSCQGEGDAWTFLDYKPKMYCTESPLKPLLYEKSIDFFMVQALQADKFNLTVQHAEMQRQNIILRQQVSQIDTIALPPHIYPTGESKIFQEMNVGTDSILSQDASNQTMSQFQLVSSFDVQYQGLPSQRNPLYDQINQNINDIKLKLASVNTSLSNSNRLLQKHNDNCKSFNLLIHQLGQQQQIKAVLGSHKGATIVNNTTITRMKEQLFAQQINIKNLNAYAYTMPWLELNAYQQLFEYLAHNSQFVLEEQFGRGYELSFPKLRRMPYKEMRMYMQCYGMIAKIENDSFLSKAKILKYPVRKYMSHVQALYRLEESGEFKRLLMKIINKIVNKVTKQFSGDVMDIAPDLDQSILSGHGAIGSFLVFLLLSINFRSLLIITRS